VLVDAKIYDLENKLESYEINEFGELIKMNYLVKEENGETVKKLGNIEKIKLNKTIKVYGLCKWGNFIRFKVVFRDGIVKNITYKILDNVLGADYTG